MDKSVLLENLSKKLLLKKYPFIEDAKLIFINETNSRLKIKFAILIDLDTVIKFANIGKDTLDSFMGNGSGIIPEFLIKINDSFMFHDIKSDIKSFVKMLYSERIDTFDLQFRITE